MLVLCIAGMGAAISWGLLSARRTRDLRRLDQTRSEFLSTVSHELRTPLTSMMGYSKLMLSGEGGQLSPAHQEYLKIIHSSMHRMNQLINDLLDVERLERGEMKVESVDVDPLDVLVHCRELMTMMARDKGLEFRFSVPDELPWLRGDRSRLIQVFSNLISNAIKYTERGFVAVQAKNESRSGVSGVQIDVMDSGFGISESEQAQLFQKFFRTESSKLSPESGTGLGLAIIRGIVLAHGGHVSLKSARGQGSTFSVWLPAATTPRS